ncbi:MAG: hypothetical protein NTY02_14210, partial [Acidobacteria bacterium]|nr:hypothetical protein [Acidobacteriota bacterium]
AECWRDFEHGCLAIDQIDYGAILASETGRAPVDLAATVPGAAPGKKASTVRDSVWHALVKSLLGDPRTMQRSVRQRLQQIAGSADDIQALTSDLIQAGHAPGTKDMQAAQAATILSTFEHLIGQIEAAAPDKVPDTLRNIATAASTMDPDLLMRAISESAESGLAAGVTRALGGFFDDGQVARLLARSMAVEGRATGRLASALSTLAPDSERQQRVLHIARSLIQAAGENAKSDVATAWRSLEHMLEGPNDKLYTSAEYASQLQEAELRSHRLRLQTPEHVDDWVGSVAADSVRKLSITLLLDLFVIEESPVVLAEASDDLAAAAEDLLAAADISEADRIVKVLNPEAYATDQRRAGVARQALDHIATSPAIGALARAAGDFDKDQIEWFSWFCTLLGPVIVDPLVGAFADMPDGAGRDRVAAAIVGFGEKSVAALSPLLGTTDWPLCRAAIQLFRLIGGDAATSALQPLVHSHDPQRLREAVDALLALKDPVAQRTLTTMLKSGAQHDRFRVVDALASCQDPWAAELLATALRETPPFGRTHDIVLYLLRAMRRVSDDKAVPIIAETMRAFSWIRPGQTMTLKRTAVGVLARMSGARAGEALRAAAAQGDPFLRRCARPFAR